MAVKASKQAFEERIERLQEIVGSLEQGQVTLEDSIKIYKEGVEHVKQCREDLDKARHEIKILTKGQWVDFLQDEKQDTASENNGSKDLNSKHTNDEDIDNVPF